LVEVRIYAEGGGEGPLLDTLFRRGWTEFFKTAGLAGRLPRVVRGGGRENTFRLFQIAVAQSGPSILPLLLVDSEGPVRQEHGPWQHLRESDLWHQPARTTDHSVFLMVQVMETWFVADRAALRRHFGSCFRENAFPQATNLESVPKAEILKGLRAATDACVRGYSKGKISYELLAAIDPAEVERRCPNAKRLLDRLRAL
jgi:hypothetical protein